MRIFAFGENPAFYHISQDSNQGSPTARKYSLLFGGAYAPNDAIYRKRYAFTEIIMPYNFDFARARQSKQHLVVLTLLTRHFDQKTAENEPFLTCFRLFFILFAQKWRLGGDHMFALISNL